MMQRFLLAQFVEEAVRKLPFRGFAFENTYSRWRGPIGQTGNDTPGRWTASGLTVLELENVG